MEKRTRKFASVPNADKGEGVIKPENFVDIINGCPPRIMSADLKCDVRVCQKYFSPEVQDCA